MQCGRLNYLNDFYRLASVAMNFYESAHHDYYICVACCTIHFLKLRGVEYRRGSNGHK